MILRCLPCKVSSEKVILHQYYPYLTKIKLILAKQGIINYLSSSELEGRYTGSVGMKKANQYVANYFEKHELLKFDSQSWYQDFTFFKSAKISNESSIKVTLLKENILKKKIGAH